MSPPRRPTASRPARRPPPERHWTRYAAPAAFLLAATIAVLLVRSGLRGTETPTTTQPVTTVSTQKAKTTRTTTRKAATTRTGAARYYTVVAGDTFGTIASKNGTTVASIEALNPGIKSTSLFIGQRIRVG
jgi:LysM repeat protein